MATACKLKNEVETWKRDHDLAMRYYYIQSVVTARMGWVSRIRAIDEEHSKQVEARTTKHDRECDEILFEAYRSWYDEAVQVDKQVAEIEQAGHAVTHAHAHREMTALVETIVDFGTEEVIRAMEDVANGKARPLLEVMDELRAPRTS